MASKNLSRILLYLATFLAGVVLAGLLSWNRISALEQRNRLLSGDLQRAVERGVWAEGRRILCEQKCPQ